MVPVSPGVLAGALLLPVQVIDTGITDHPGVSVEPSSASSK
jgi:hypothetical protein